MIRLMLAFEIQLVLGTRDVKRAFRFNTIDPEQGQEFAWVVWMSADGRVMKSRHLVSWFGSVSSVFNWHRTGEFILTVAKRIVKCVVSRYVD